jgi:hypothetical protein
MASWIGAFPAGPPLPPRCRTLIANACVLALHQGEMHRLRSRSWQLGIYLPDQSFHGPPCRRGPDAIEVSGIAAEARKFVLDLTNKVRIREGCEFLACRWTE